MPIQCVPLSFSVLVLKSTNAGVCLFGLSVYSAIDVVNSGYKVLIDMKLCELSHTYLTPMLCIFG